MKLSQHLFLLMLTVFLLGACKTTKKVAQTEAPPVADDVVDMRDDRRPPMSAEEEAVDGIIRVGGESPIQTLQEAFDMVQDGMVIEVYAGEYISEQPLILKGRKNVMINGLDGAWVITTNPAANVMWLIGCHGIKIDNLKMTHKLPGEQVKCTGNVIALSGVSRTVIRNCDINGCGAIGVFGEDVKSLLVEGNKIHKNTLWPIYITGNDLNIKNNNIEYNGNQNLIQLNGQPIKGNHTEEGSYLIMDNTFGPPLIK